MYLSSGNGTMWRPSYLSISKTFTSPAASLAFSTILHHNTSSGIGFLRLFVRNNNCQVNFGPRVKAPNLQSMLLETGLMFVTVHQVIESGVKKSAFLGQNRRLFIQFLRKAIPVFGIESGVGKSRESSFFAA